MEAKILNSFSEKIRPKDRPRLLYNYANSFVSIAHLLYRRLEASDGFTGKLARFMAFPAGPFVRRMEQQWLSSVSFVDSVILRVEAMLVYLFPMLESVFGKINELDNYAEIFPEKFDEMLDYIPNFSTLVSKLGNMLMDVSSRDEEVEQMEDREGESDDGANRPEGEDIVEDLNRSKGEDIVEDDNKKGRRKKRNKGQGKEGKLGH